MLLNDGTRSLGLWREMLLKDGDVPVFPVQIAEVGIRH